MKIGIIIQARMNSTRLPGKVLKPIAGKCLLDHILDRLSLLENLFNIVVATTNSSLDDLIVTHCNSKNIAVFRGSEDDVLGRYYECARVKHFEHIIRLTADNPFTDIEELHNLFEQHITQKNDYTHSFGSMPLGVGAEIFSFQALKKSAKSAYAPNHREHVNEYIQEHPHLFKIGILNAPYSKHSKNLRLTIDTEEDYYKLCLIAERSIDQYLSTEELISLCSQSV